MAFALVTGASAGIGREFAVQIAARGDDLVLVARDADRLEALAAELRSTRGVDVEVLRADLAHREDVGVVAERLAAVDRPVELLVNNAGYSLKKSFLENEVADEEAMFDVLSRAVMVLSHAAGRAMRTRRSGTIVNVSSVASFIASGTYSANKAFVTVLSESLASELAEDGVKVMALCPGFTHTEFHERAGLRMDGVPGFMWLDAAVLVQDALDDAESGRVVCVPSWRYKVIVGALRVMPRSFVRARGRRAHRPSSGSRPR